MVQARRKTPQKIDLRIDPVLLSSAIALAVLGLIMVASASVAIAEKNDLPLAYFAMKHAVALTLGLGLAWAAVRIPLENLERASPLLLPLVVAMLLLVFVPGLGQRINGSARWIDLGVMQFQVVEAVKILFIIFLSGYAVKHHEKICTSLRGLVAPCVAAAILAVLLLAQPDFGGAVLIIGVTGGILWIAGARFRDLSALALLALPVMLWVALSESYRLRRLRSFLDPWADPFNEGFQLTQALIAVGRGEWFGVGLGGSVQKLFYLPEAHTDFIVAVLAEELGFIGLVVLLALFATLIGRGLVVSMHALNQGHPFAAFLSFGISTLIGLQVLISVGVNLGVLPTKGLTLPLISSGGSSVMMTGLAIGLLLRAAAETDLARPPDEAAEASNP
ncbi:MAG: putative lipid II flippase FtsW [Xanthomonadales bacterium]|nr:putative lipid II flippase FtsW [Xanthomonadales bacterium]